MLIYHIQLLEVKHRDKVSKASFMFVSDRPTLSGPSCRETCRRGAIDVSVPVRPDPFRLMSWVMGPGLRVCSFDFPSHSVLARAC